MTRRSTTLARASAIVTAVAIAFGAQPARAQDVSQKLAADALFREARKLLNAGKVAEACPKLAESQRLEPAAGTLLNLADCYERSGQNAAAWITFKEAASSAVARGRADWEKTASQRAAALEKKLGRMALSATSLPRDAEVKRDDALVPTSTLGVPVMVDPGRHTVTVTAKGKRTWSTTVEVRAGAVETVTIPELEDDAPRPEAPSAAEPHASPPPEPSSSDGALTPTLGLVLAGVGGVGVVVGGVTGVLALSNRSDAASKCESYPTRCSQEGADLNDTAKSMATVSTVGLVAGGVLVAAGATLYFLTPSRDVRAGMAADGSGARFAVEGRF